MTPKGKSPRFLSSLGALALLAGGLGACAVPPPDVAPHPLAAPRQPVERARLMPPHVASFTQVGLASWYGRDFHRKPTASGEPYDMNELTAAHRTLPIDTIARVTNLANGRSILVRINDRGPYAEGRVIDLSRSAANLLDMKKDGVAPVRVEVFDSDQGRTVADALRLD
jgi:rare lipoprotein A